VSTLLCLPSFCLLSQGLISRMCVCVCVLYKFVCSQTLSGNPEGSQIYLNLRLLQRGLALAPARILGHHYPGTAFDALKRPLLTVGATGVISLSIQPGPWLMLQSREMTLDFSLSLLLLLLA
jgi:hypothetical protein